MLESDQQILKTCLDTGWITAEQAENIKRTLERLPGVKILDLFSEQQLLDEEKILTLRDVHDISRVEKSKNSSVIHIEENPRLHHVNDYLKQAIRTTCSDVHIGPWSPPLLRLNGELVPIIENSPKLEPEESERLAKSFMTPEQIREVEETGTIDFCYEIKGVGRFRACVVRQRAGWESVFRVIRTKIPNMGELGLPDIMYSLTHHHHGIVLVTGTTGSGKSTTLAAMIENINQTRYDHIVTLEDPIEYTFSPSLCQISQREIYTHTQSFSSALRASLREDPDVIMVGEMRDLDTIYLALMAAETGHLVLSTLHTNTAARTLDRILDVFPGEQQEQIRTSLSESLRGIICQQLIPKADQSGRVLALEILVNTPGISNLIREGKTFLIPSVIQTEKQKGMILMDDSLKELVDKKIITAEEALRRTENKNLFALPTL